MADSRFDNLKYLCWLKICMALIFAKEGLEKLTDRLAKEFHDDLKNRLGNSECCSCSKEELKKQWQNGRWRCRTNVCNRWLDEIRRNLQPQKETIEWDNSDISCLPSKPWECIKLFMPYGCESVTEAAKADIAAILTLFINNSHFLNHIGGSTTTNNLEKVKQVRNKVMHSCDLELEETKMDKYIDRLIQMLKCHPTLDSDQACKEAISKIQKLRSDILQVSVHKELELRSLNVRVKAMEGKFNQSLNHLNKQRDELVKLNISNTGIQNDIDVINNKYREFCKSSQEVKNEIEHMGRSFSTFLRANGIEGVDIGQLIKKTRALDTLINDVTVMKSEIIGLKTRMEELESNILYKREKRMPIEDRKKEHYSYFNSPRPSFNGCQTEIFKIEGEQAMETKQRRVCLVKQYAWIKEEMDRTVARSIADYLYQEQLLPRAEHESILHSSWRREAVEQLLKKILMGPHDIHVVFIRALKEQEETYIANKLLDTCVSDREIELFTTLEKSSLSQCPRPDSHESRFTLSDGDHQTLQFYLNNKNTIEILNDNFLSRFLFSIREHTNVCHCLLDDERRVQLLLDTMKKCSDSIFGDLCEVLDTMVMNHVIGTLEKSVDTTQGGPDGDEPTNSSVTRRQLIDSSGENKVVSSLQKSLPSLSEHAQDQIGFDVENIDTGSIVIKLRPKKTDSLSRLKESCYSGTIKEFIPFVYNNEAIQDQLQEGEYRLLFTIYTLPVPPESEDQQKIIFVLETDPEKMKETPQPEENPINDNIDLLCEELEISKDLLSVLKKEKMVGDNIKEEIDKQGSRAKKIKCLLKTVKSHGTKGYEVLKDFIKEDNKDLYNALVTRDGVKEIDTKMNAAADVTDRSKLTDSQMDMLKKELFFSGFIVLKVTKKGNTLSMDNLNPKSKVDAYEISCPEIINPVCHFNSDKGQSTPSEELTKNFEVARSTEGEYKRNKPERRIGSSLRHRGESSSNPDIPIDERKTRVSEQKDIPIDERKTRVSVQKELQRHLIKLYENDHSSMSVYQLKPHLTRKLDEMYVPPEMVEKNPRGQTKPQPDLADRLEHTKGQRDRKIETLKDVFFKNGELCKNIYVTGEAGIGKSTFCKYIVRMWLKAHSNQTDDTSSDSEVMKHFPLLFYVQLRGVKLGTETGEWAKLIKKQLNLNDGLDNFYSNENSLIIADSLDEIAGGLPFRGVLDKSTKLTTSRPWKLEASRENIYRNRIDRQIEIVCISERSAETLVEKLLPVLAEESVNVESTKVSERDSQSFITEMKNKNLVSFLRIPVLLIQVLCLWYDDNLAKDESQLSIYKKLLCYQIKLSKISREISQDKYEVLGCKSLKCPCNNVSDIVVKLGKLAFNALVSENRQNELIFDHSITEMHGLSKEDVDICLRVGCLSKHKLFGKLSDDPKMYVSFVHKTNQEYFASIYLAYKVSNIKSVSESAIGNLDKMLELEKVLTFVSGLHPEKGLEMATLLLAAVETDPRVLEYRQTAGGLCGSPHDNLISNVQNAILAAMEECWRRNKRQLNLPLMDIVVNDKNMSSVSSSLVSQESPIASISIVGDYIPADNLFTLFNTSQLQKVALSLCTISGATVRQLIPRSLCVLYLEYVRMSHADLSGLCSQLTAAENLREVKLSWLKCETHGGLNDGRCVGLSLDLGELRELRELHIGACDVPALVLSPHMSHLQSVYLGWVTTTAAIVRKLVDSLHRNNVMVRLFHVTIRHEEDAPSPDAILEIIYSRLPRVTIRHEVDAPSPDAILDNIRRSCTVKVDHGVERKENGDLLVKGFVFRYK